MRYLVVLATGPPAGGSRSERWANLAPELVRRGHCVVILRSELPAGYPAVDPGLARQLADGGVETETIGSTRLARWRYAINPTSVSARCRRGLAELVWPDCWTSFAVQATRWLKERASAFDCIVTPVQPFSGLFVGYYAATQLGLPWIADYGDPWSMRFSSGVWRRTREARIEDLLLAHVSAVVVTTNATADLFAREGSLQHRSLHVIPAGVLWQPSGVPPPPPPLVIVQSGTVYGPRLSLHPFVEAVHAYRSLHGAGSLRLIWYGDVSRPEERLALRAVADDYHTRGTLSEISTAEAGAHAHIVLGNHGGVQVPAKVWRILGTHRIPLVITANPKDPLRDLPELGPISVFALNDRPSILEALQQVRRRALTHLWAAPHRPLGLPDWRERAASFERVTTAGSGAVRSIVPSAPAATRLIVQGTLLGMGAARLGRLLGSRSSIRR